MCVTCVMNNALLVFFFLRLTFRFGAHVGGEIDSTDDVTTGTFKGVVATEAAATGDDMVAMIDSTPNAPARIDF